MIGFGSRMRLACALGMALAGPLLVSATGAASVAGAAAAPDSFTQAVEVERRETLTYFRENPHSPLAAILREDVPRAGWLTIGSAPDNDVVLEDRSVAPHHARVSIDGSGFRVEAVDDTAHFMAGKETTRAATVPPSWIVLGRYHLRLSYQNAPAVIVFDPTAPALKTARVPSWFPVDPRYRFVLPLVADAKRDTVLIESTHGQPRPSLRVGHFEFALDGRTYRLGAYRLLEPGVPQDDLGLYFRDRTSGKESYAVGRYLDAVKLPDGRYVVDFNQAYNPSCAYSPYYNCPIPPPENRIAATIRAGESWLKEAK
ncbi:MAG: DUF1684 domain-containing protein [Candidatus Eiseniibacteriota bacterium]